MKTIGKVEQQSITPEKAIELLRNGNARFVQNLRYNRNLLQQVNETADGQFPFATILSCIDSRTTAELIFDQGLGDIFSIRIAGNVVNDDILGSLEFAGGIAGSKLIVVLGHTNCGAIRGACDHVDFGHLTGLLHKIQPAIQSENKFVSDRTGANLDFVNEVAKHNVKKSMDVIVDKSSILRDLISQKKIDLVGGIYDVSTGEVIFFNRDRH